MGSKAIDPQSIRNVTLVGELADTSRLVHRLRHRFEHTAVSSQLTLDLSFGGTGHRIRLTEQSSRAPIAALERAIRVADSVVAVHNAAAPVAARSETVLRVADDHQVARLCLITGLDHPAADFTRTLQTIAATRGATPLVLHTPAGTGPAFEGVIDLLAAQPLADVAAEIYGPHWPLAEHHYRALVAALPGHPGDDMHTRIRLRTRVGDIVPILCSPYPCSDDLPPFLDAILRYLPSPLDVCQPEHALDY
ncbi:hypothetical protein D7D52_36805 [Nocardia yunnanensis]|uniref:Uncharacterized protein n=1 Tax=Nocardia yunnanensis TaxID=2382165 RepID=A0A386ZLM7_9NOCA|nr:hypothetical protein [Nocardia yunnanensis]AYF78471.1 hypothetical protein D7D52_36805 [Nocardia yunnanensis]